MLFQLILILVVGMVCGVYDSDSESVTSSQSSRSSRCRSNSRDGRNSSAGSRNSNAHEWEQLSEFDDLAAADEFLKTVLTKNATRTSNKPYCVFYDRANDRKHKMSQQIRVCQCAEGCPIQFRYRKCIDCNKASICQSEGDHTGSDLDPERTLRGKLKK